MLGGLFVRIAIISTILGLFLFLPGVRKGKGSGWVLLGLLFLFVALLAWLFLITSLFKSQ